MSAEHWLRQAEDDLDVARLYLARGFWSEACFMGEETAHAAMRSLLALRDALPHMRCSRMKLDILTNFIRQDYRSLWSELPEQAAVYEDAALLDPYYRDARYPAPEGKYPIPYQAFTEQQARDAVSLAGQVVDCASNWLVIEKLSG